MEAQVQDPKTGEFVGIGTAFLKRIDERERWQAELVRGVARTYIQSQGVDDLAIRSSRIAEAHKYSEPEIFASQVLSRLRFPSIKDRQHRIPKAYKQTYEWIFTDDNKIGHRWASYTQWLEKKSGLYWITGKPGAGKSTMMKFLARDPRTEDHLRTWSAGSQLLISRFFFWNSGQQIQMSKEGLLRSLLYEVLENCGHLAPVLFPAKWEVFSLFGQTVEETWTWLELDRALKKLLEIGVSQQMKFCFFIDGLDEFDGSPFELVNFFQELVGDASHVKACISSRPWTMFEDAFKACPHFSLEDLTSDDITHFITTKLENNGGFREMQAKDSRFAPQLIADIAKKSSGVFLWVDLVMQSLLEGLTDGDHTAELHRRVDQLPDDLESLFREILEGVRRQNPAYFVSASKFFQLVRAALEPLTLNCLYMADEDSEDPAFFDKVRLGPSTAEERWSRAATMKRRLNSRTKGLLEVDRFSNVSLCFCQFCTWKNV